MDEITRYIGNLLSSISNRIRFGVEDAAETLEAKASGLAIHRAKRIKYSSLFGVVEILSPYCKSYAGTADCSG